MIYIIALAMIFAYCKNDKPPVADPASGQNLAQEPTIFKSDTIIQLDTKMPPEAGKEASNANEPKKILENDAIQDETAETSKISVPVDEDPEFGQAIEQIGSEKTVGRHDQFDELLSRFVSTGGLVNYKGLKKQAESLNAYLETLKATNPSSLNRKEALAFWINAYNAFTLKLIIDNYPLKSITDLDNGKPWDRKWIDINGKNYSLNQIENEIIRPQFKEPRIHFAVNCAAKSCPALLNRAWTAENLENKLEEQTRKFINNSKYNSIAPNQLAISRIFDWYSDDFGDIRQFIDAYHPADISDDATISYLEYDWSLNEL